MNERDSNRAQVSSPIQLLLGVTIMSFVLVIGFFTYEKMAKNQYEQKIKASMSKLARNVELVHHGGIGTTKTINVDFSPTKGSKLNLESIRVLPGTTETCKRQTGMGNCLELIAIQSLEGEKVGILTIEALDVPSTINLEKKSPEGKECDKSLAYDQWNSQWNTNESQKCGWLPKKYSVTVQKKSAGHLVIK